MKKIFNLLRNTSLILTLAAAITAHGWDTSGFVLCDANQNGIIDTNDVVVPGVLVVVTNLSGTFSNAAWTTFQEGYYFLDLPDQPDTYVEYLHPLTLPENSVIVLPPGGTYPFTLDNTNQNTFQGSFLLSNSACITITDTNPPPPPGTNVNVCCVTASGSIKDSGGVVQHKFAGAVFPPCKANSSQVGVWTDTAVQWGLCLKGKILQVLNCGTFTNTVDDTILVGDFIEFQGSGTLKQNGVCTAVTFFVRLEDFGAPGKNLDRYYLRVTASDNTVLLLVSADEANPLNVAPVLISSGNVRFSNCQPAENKQRGKGQDGHKQNGKGKGDKGKDNEHGNKGGKNKGDNCDDKNNNKGKGKGH